MWDNAELDFDDRKTNEGRKCPFSWARGARILRQATLPSTCTSSLNVPTNGKLDMTTQQQIVLVTGLELPLYPRQRNVTRIASVSCKSTPELMGKTSTVKGPLILPSLVSYV